MWLVIGLAIAILVFDASDWFYFICGCIFYFTMQFIINAVRKGHMKLDD